MSLKESIIAALENLQGERIGLAGATRDQTILDCMAVIRSIPDDDGWISVEERLPEKCEGVIVWDEFERDVFTGGMTAAGTWSIDGFEGAHFHITHWMPLPEPPKEVG